MTSELLMLLGMTLRLTITMILGVVLGPGCGTPSAPPERVVDAAPLNAPDIIKVTPAEPPPVTHVRKPDRYVLEIELSENAATETQRVANQLCRIIEGRAVSHSAPVFASTFGARWAGRRSADDPTASIVARRPIEPAPSWIEQSAFTEQLRSWGDELREVTRCGLKHWRFRLFDGERLAWARTHFVLSGVTQTGARIERRVDLQANFSSTPWRLQAVEILSGETIRRESGAFQDVSDQVGIRQYRAAATDKTIQNQVDAGSIETMGGLGVIDWNQDGRDDLMSWVRRRTLQIFINDGRGGFDVVVNPIAPEHVGLAMLYLDLNGNGRPELVSSEVLGCEDGVGWLGLYEHTAEGVVSRGAKLQFALDCPVYQRARFQHLNVDDIDGDGDLDLFAAGFQLGAADQGRQNVFHATSGLPNLLFRNDGKLKFSERARQGGFAGTSYSYGSTFLDIDGDGDRDLYVVNDYGPNTLYRNQGKARFQSMALAPLTANGQSMGVTVADLTGDGAWDIYVSNMYSHAGNRIVPLAEDSFKAPDFKALLRLAAGNALYTPTAEGGYLDAAPDLGLTQAGWSWGQSVFDPDNDGDWDVYVVNGNTSNRDARAPEY